MLEISRIETEVRRQLADREGLLGVLLLGSISAGMQDETSDYDIQLVFTDEALISHPEYRDLQIRLDAKCDCRTTSPGALDRMDRHGYDIREYLHACFLIDDSGVLRTVTGN